MLKYIGYYAELPVGLPKAIEDQIVQDVQTTPFNQGDNKLYKCVNLRRIIELLYDVDLHIYNTE